MRTFVGSGYESLENDQYWRYLGFSGGYSGSVFTGLTLGITELESVYQTLIRYPDYKDGQRSLVERSCKRIMVMLGKELTSEVLAPGKSGFAAAIALDAVAGSDGVAELKPLSLSLLHFQ